MSKEIESPAGLVTVAARGEVLEMVDRVARAIWCRMFDEESPGTDSAQFALAKECARAAIEAMRGPVANIVEYYAASPAVGDLEIGMAELFDEALKPRAAE